MSYEFSKNKLFGSVYKIQSIILKPIMIVFLKSIVIYYVISLLCFKATKITAAT